MKKLVIFLFALFITGVLTAQPVFNLGVKGGINVSQMSFDRNDFSSESILKTHVGAFARIGWSSVYLQPEVYYSAKGGEVIESGSTPSERVSRFDYNTVDVPVLLGVKLIKGSAANLRIMGGPVFCIMTNKELDANNLLSKEYYNDHYIGYQYGVGVDLLRFFIDARMEHGSDRLYQQPADGLNGKNRTFMVSVGFKIL